LDIIVEVDGEELVDLVELV